MKASIISLFALLSGAVSLDSFAQNADYLPELPSASDMTSSDFGQHFSVTMADGESKEGVVLVGIDQSGRSISFPIEGAPQTRSTFTAAVQGCVSKGTGWTLPTIDDLRMLTPYARSQDLRFLPGSSWTSTLAPCDACLDAKRFKMAYDIQSANVRNTYDQPLFKFYPTCVYRK